MRPTCAAGWAPRRSKWMLPTALGRHAGDIVAARLPSQHWPQQPVLIAAIDAHTLDGAPPPPGPPPRTAGPRPSLPKVSPGSPAEQPLGPVRRLIPCVPGDRLPVAPGQSADQGTDTAAFALAVSHARMTGRRPQRPAGRRISRVTRLDGYIGRSPHTGERGDGQAGASVSCGGRDLPGALALLANRRS